MYIQKSYIQKIFCIISGLKQFAMFLLLLYHENVPKNDMPKKKLFYSVQKFKQQKKHLSYTFHILLIKNFRERIRKSIKNWRSHFIVRTHKYFIILFVLEIFLWLFLEGARNVLKCNQFWYKRSLGWNKTFICQLDND